MSPTDFYVNFHLKTNPSQRFSLPLPWKSPGFDFNQMDDYLRGALGDTQHDQTRGLKLTQNIPEPSSTNWFMFQLDKQNQIQSAA
jgi:hypothetical protein